MPFTLRERKSDLRISKIRKEKVLWKPKRSRTWSRKCQLRVSNALEISIFTATSPPITILGSRFIAFEVTQRQSLICLPLIKPFWLGDTILLVMWASLSAKILEMILNLKLATSIGLKSLIFSTQNF